MDLIYSQIESYVKNNTLLIVLERDYNPIFRLSMKCKRVGFTAENYKFPTPFREIFSIIDNEYSIVQNYAFI